MVTLIRRCGQGPDHLSNPIVPSNPTTESLSHHPRVEFQGPSLCDSKPNNPSAIEITMQAELEAVLGFDSPVNRSLKGHDSINIARNDCQQDDIRTGSSASFLLPDHAEESQLIECMFGSRKGFVEV